jgi:hypothetical protein
LKEPEEVSNQNSSSKKAKMITKNW